MLSLVHRVHHTTIVALVLISRGLEYAAIVYRCFEYLQSYILDLVKYTAYIKSRSSIAKYERHLCSKVLYY